MKTSKSNQTRHDREWQLQEAKNRLSQVVDSALHDGPQTITVRGKPAAVVVSFEEFRKLSQPRIPLSRFFRESPLRAAELDLTRSTDPAREVEL
ncbi:type II toxin-antitoxin system Phd/YefM family antitoxin [Geobacter grbiciae]|uniref:type II toxin-antitoxin system Phd/YefM family antitoxin n=1 Tax=Geobacter grbiciae TaxID=155042 RepID=UPI001C01F609|nr:type II toxin-antitoxin system Phd/YefM family antitoxin [Geobacter grbiciae]MBT1074296.1 type II toxin-antitoxin system Phd/YefM family antitoxin [Geobacter grbiciae]